MVSSVRFQSTLHSLYEGMKESDQFENTLLSAFPPALMKQLETLFPHEKDWKNLKWILEDLARNGRIDGRHGYSPEVMTKLAGLTLSSADAQAIVSKMKALNPGMAGFSSSPAGAAGSTGGAAGGSGSGGHASGAGGGASGASGGRGGASGGHATSGAGGGSTGSGGTSGATGGASGTTLAGYNQPIASWNPAGLATKSQLKSFLAACEKGGVFTSALHGSRTPDNAYQPTPEEVRQYKAFADQTERALGLPKGLLNGQIIQESNYNPRETMENRDPTLGLGQVRVSDVRRIADRGLLPEQFRTGGSASDAQIASALLDGRFNILMMGLQHVDKQLELGPQGLSAKLGYAPSQARWNYDHGTHASGPGSIDTSVLSYTDNKREYLDRLKSTTVPLILKMGDSFLKSGYAGNREYWNPAAGLRDYAGKPAPDMAE